MTSPRTSNRRGTAAASDFDKLAALALRQSDDLEPGRVMGGGICGWCHASLVDRRRPARWCSKRCRQTAWRFRGHVAAGVGDGKKLRLAYADPPYPERSHYYRDRPEYAGEVNQFAILRSLLDYNGWALSTSSLGVRLLAPSLPAAAKICVWVKTHHPPAALGPGNVHEFVIVKPARLRRGYLADALVAAVARGGDSDLIGRKPVKFCAWLFELLGAAPGDDFDDVFPGSGVVSRCWNEFCRGELLATRKEGSSNAQAER